MTFLPVVTREMSVLARRQSTYWARAVTAAIAVLTMLWLLLVSASHVSLSQLGSSIFLILSSFCFGFSLLAGMQATSDCVSEEKREGTLGLLFLTDLRGFDVIFGKLAASSFHGFFALLGVVPMLSLALLLGGVTLRELGQTALVLFNSLFLSLSLGVLVSSLSKNERKAMLACFSGLFALTLMPFIISFAWSGFEKVYAELAMVSPLYSFLSAQNATGINKNYLAAALVLQHALGWGFLALAARILPRCVNDLPRPRFARFQAMIDNYVFGRREQRARHRAELLDRNPFLWLASRERIKPRYAWVIVGFFALLFLWVYDQFPEMLYDPATPLTIIFLVHFSLKIWVASEVCNRLIADRRSGALELLLSTPLSVPDIALGQELALRRIFRRPALVLTLVEVALAFLILKSGRADISASNLVLLYGSALAGLWMDMWALKWVGLWLSLFGKSMERVLIATVARVLGLPVLALLILGGTLSAVLALQNESVPAGAFYASWLVFNTVFAALCAVSARRNFLRYFREAAAQTFSSRASPSKFRSAQRAPARHGFRGTLLELARQHWILSGATLIVAAAALAVLGRHFYWSRQLRAELARIQASRSPVSMAEAGKVYPPVPARENAFAELSRSVAARPGRWMQLHESLRLLQRFENHDALAEASQFLAAQQPQLDALRSITNFSRAYLDPETAVGWMLPIDLAGYTMLAVSDLALALNDRQAPAATTDLLVLLHLARLLRDQPLQRLQIACREILEIASKGSTLAINRDLLTPAALKLLQSEIEAVSPSTLDSTLRLERARLIDLWGHPDPRLAGGAPMLASAASGLISLVGSYQKQLVQILRGYAWLESAHRNEKYDFNRPELASLRSVGNQTVTRWSVVDPPEIQNLVEIDASIQLQRAVLQTAFAAEMYRSQKGSYPNELRQLVPERLQSVPNDPFRGTPLTCHQQKEGLIICTSPPEPSNGQGESRLLELRIPLQRKKTNNAPTTPDSRL